MVDPNIKILLFLVKAPNVDVIIHFSVSLIFVSLSNEKIFIPMLAVFYGNSRFGAAKN